MYGVVAPFKGCSRSLFAGNAVGNSNVMHNECNNKLLFIKEHIIWTLLDNLEQESTG